MITVTNVLNMENSVHQMNRVLLVTGWPATTPAVQHINRTFPQTGNNIELGQYMSTRVERESGDDVIPSAAPDRTAGRGGAVGYHRQTFLSTFLFVIFHGTPTQI